MKDLKTEPKSYYRIRQTEAPHYYVAPQTPRARARYGGYRLSYLASAGWKVSKRKNAQDKLDEIIGYYREVLRLEPTRKFSKSPEELFEIVESAE